MAVFATPVSAQTGAGTNTRVELSASVGRTLGPWKPAVRTGGAGVTFWFGDHWGLSWNANHGFGSEAWPPDPFFRGVGADTGLSTGNLYLYRIVARYRRHLSGPLTLVLGGGLMSTRTDSVRLRAETTGIRQYVRRDPDGGFSYEVQLKLHVGWRLSIQGGLTTDLDGDRVLYYQPILGAVVGF